MGTKLEWTEWHLTPCGWVSGSEKTDFGNVVEVEPPPDRVMTCRLMEQLDGPYEEPKQMVDIVWKCTDPERLQTLQTRFGECPHRL